MAVDTGQHAIERALEMNRQYRLEQNRRKRLAYEWHLKRRQREQGRLTTPQWLTWAKQYVAGLEESLWRDFCYEQVRQVSTMHALFGRD